jgi:CubicO group peptidase (beta-lactamase class C family)
MHGSSSRGRTVAIAAGALAILSIAAIAVGISLVTTLPIHESAAAIASDGAVVPERYARAVEDARQHARALIVDANLPGLSAAAAVNGEIVWAESFGWSDAETRTPLTTQTRFRLGALSKPLTATAALRLRDQGRLDLDAPVQRYVPAYPAKQWTVTTRQLLGDVGGVHRLRGDNNDAMPVDHCDGVDEAVALLKDDPLLFEPGTEHRYSIWGWVLVSAAIERAAGEPFDRVMARHVFEPLGMRRTVAIETGDIDDGPPKFVAPRGLLGVRLGAKEAMRPDYSCLAGGGALFSTPSDLVRFSAAVLKPGLLQADTIAALQTPARLRSGARTTYALGWTVSNVDLAGKPVRMISHRGSPMGGSVSLLVFPETGLSIAVAANAGNGRVHPLALQVAESFGRQP